MAAAAAITQAATLLFPVAAAAADSFATPTALLLFPASPSSFFSACGTPVAITGPSVALPALMLLLVALASAVAVATAVALVTLPTALSSTLEKPPILLSDACATSAIVTLGRDPLSVAVNRAKPE